MIRINFFFLNGHRDRDGGPTRTLLTRSYILERINRLSGSCKVGYATRRLGCCFSYCDLHWQELFSSVFKQLSATGLFKLIRICSNIPPSLAFQIQFGLSSSTRLYQISCVEFDMEFGVIGYGLYGP